MNGTISMPISKYNGIFCRSGVMAIKFKGIVALHNENCLNLKIYIYFPFCTFFLNQSKVYNNKRNNGTV